jgi:RHS repeat-associated protein
MGNGLTLSANAFVIPAVQAIDSGQQLESAEKAKLASPEEALLREESQTRFEGMSPERAATLARQEFPNLIDHPAGGPPALPHGDAIVGYTTDRSAQVALGGGRHGALESVAPIALETSRGRHEAINLSPVSTGGGFGALRPLVPVSLPNRLEAGAALPHAGVSLTPVDPAGRALQGSAGVIDGWSVFYGGVGADMDAALRPTTFGLEYATLLRSPKAPEALYFRIGLPKGATLSPPAGSLGAIGVIDDGRRLASVALPTAHDAAGTTVPLSTSISGDTVRVDVRRRPGEYRYPIEVDPTIEDKTLRLTYVGEGGTFLVCGSGTHGDDWAFHTDNPEAFCPENSFDTVTGFHEGVGITSKGGKYSSGQYGVVGYPTQGESHIYEFLANVYSGQWYGKVRGALSIARSSGEVENGTHVVLPEPTQFQEWAIFEGERQLCVEGPSCATGVVNSSDQSNQATLEVYATPTEPSSNSFGFFLRQGTAVMILQEAHPTDSVSAIGNGWVSTSPGGFSWRGGLAVAAHDPGIGIMTERFSSPSKSGWGFTEVKPGGTECVGVQCNECYEAACIGHGSGTGSPLTMHDFAKGGGELPEGEDTLEATVEDAAGLSATSATKVRVDNSPPHNLTLRGLPSTGEIGEGTYNLRAEATDDRSGVASVGITIDGREASATGSPCEPGPCTAGYTHVLSGAKLGAGQHKVVVSAQDNAGNSATRSFIIFVRAAGTPVPVGPGSVNPSSGDFNLAATDVSVSGGTTALTLSRTYNSRYLAPTIESPLGPQWTMSFSGQQGLVRLPDGSVSVTAANGSGGTFARTEAGAFTPPPGDQNITLTEVQLGGLVREYVLRNSAANTTTRFTPPAGAANEVFMPTVSEGPVATDTTSYSFRTVEGVTEPTEALAPVPQGVSCAPELHPGCRALTFNYGSQTKASGEAPGEWGEYKGRLQSVVLHAFDPSKKQMTESTVAEYSYDAQGRLRAEWNPQLSPALKTTYGYDVEGHLTALSPPGQEPWLAHYEQSQQEVGEGESAAVRLLALSRPTAATPLEANPPPKSTSPPTLSSASPAFETMLSVASNGSWSNSPLTYGYQWKRCNGSGQECAPIIGAVNANYKTTGADAGHTLVLQVTATNADGSSSATSAPTSVIAAPKIFGGSAGREAGRFFGPTGVAVDSHGHLWVADEGNDRVQEFGAGGEALGQIGSTGTYPCGGVLCFPTGVAVHEGNVWVTDDLHERLLEFHENGQLVREVGKEGTGEGQFGTTDPSSLAVDAQGNVWVADSKNRRVEEFNSEGRFERQFGSAGSGDGQFEWIGGIAIAPNGSIWVSDLGHDRIEQFSLSGGSVKFTKALGWGVKDGKAQLEVCTEACRAGIRGAGTGQLAQPLGVAVDPSGDLLVVDSLNYRVEEFNEAGEYIGALGTKAEGLGLGARPPGQLASIPWGIALDSEGHVYVSDMEGESVLQWPTAPGLQRPTPTSGYTVHYQVPLTGTEAPYAMGEAEVARWKQKDLPSSAIAVFPPDEPQAFPASDYRRATVYYMDSKGRTVNLASPGGGVGTSEYNSSNELVRALSPDNRARVLSEGIVAGERASELLDTRYTYSSEGTELLETLGPEHKVKLSSGAEVQARPHVVYRYDEGAPTEGGPYRLPTKLTEAAQLASGEQKDLREHVTSYAGQSNLGWTLRKPTSSTTEPGGLRLTHATLYSPETGEVTESRGPEGASGGSAHDAKYVYYSVHGTSEYPGCEGHAEWAGLLCETLPVKQPETAGLPKLPVTTVVSYNVYDEPLETVESFGTTTRTKKQSYDSAGRPLTTSISSSPSVDVALPPVTDEYSPESGALVKQSTTAEGVTHSDTSVYNRLGELRSYTDANNTTSTYEYDIDGRPTELNDGKGIQGYEYDETTGLPTKLVDSGAGTFTASYDAEGKMTSEGYPDGLVAQYGYNQGGERTSVQYVKTTNCSSNCTWLTDSVTPSIHGKWLAQTSSLSSETYTYDGQGRLTQVQDTPAEKGCTTRSYSYDEEGNRTSLTARPPGAEGKCATEGGTAENHSYDEGNRLIDAGTSYDPFGDVEKLPAKDAGGSELISHYYVDGQAQRQEQGGQTIGYELDPAGRASKITSEGNALASEEEHYSGPGSAPSWTGEMSGQWTRKVAGIGGGLVATQHDGEEAVLELPNLHGDILCTATRSESATHLSGCANTTEFGVPSTEAPPKYSWLGEHELQTVLPSGVIAMGVRSYVPQLGRFLQPDPVPGGSENAYAYTFGDPVNTFDLTGAYSATLSQGLIEGVEQRAGVAAAEVLAREEAARREAERIAAEEAARAAAEAAWQARNEAWWAMYDHCGMACTAEFSAQAASEEEWYEEEEWGEEEGGYEYVSWHQGAKPDGEGAHEEAAVLVQPLVSEGVEANKGRREGRDALGPTLPLCKARVARPCARTVKDSSTPKRCANGMEDATRCRKYWRHHRTGGITGKDVTCTFAGAVGGVFGDWPGAIGAGGACVALYPG